MWINLFQDTLAALALATDPPVPRVLDQKPEPRSAPLINTPMWKMMIGQSIYQLTVTLILYFAGSAILSYNDGRDNKQLKALVFNTYVWMQIFNMYKYVFSSLLHSPSLHTRTPMHIFSFYAFLLFLEKGIAIVEN